jgi:hypothetical protein
VTVAEFRVGIELADSRERAASRSRRLDVLPDGVDVLDYSKKTDDCPASQNLFPDDRLVSPRSQNRTSAELDVVGGLASC